MYLLMLSLLTITFSIAMTLYTAIHANLAAEALNIARRLGTAPSDLQPQSPPSTDLS